MRARTSLLVIANVFFLFLAVFCAVPTDVQAYVSVKGYYKANGTYVAPYVRSNPNGLKYDNYGYKPSQGLYNSTYGTKGAAWDTPTYVTDPNYYQGKALYEQSKTVVGSSYSTYSKIPAIHPARNVSYVTSAWVSNNPNTPCNQATLRAAERAECITYRALFNSYKWNVTTTEFDNIHYRWDPELNMSYMCSDGYSFRYDTATGKPKELCYPDL
ncbi:MAG: hypothetical protein AAB472_00240 [Patescibacteria group bacterium]